MNKANINISENVKNKLLKTNIPGICRVADMIEMQVLLVCIDNKVLADNISNFVKTH